MLSLFSGICGLDLGVRMAIPNARTCCYVERDDYCQRVIQARIRDGVLDDAPIWDDVTDFDGEPWRGHIDLICGGFPCQPWSYAGSRREMEDERWLWPEFARVIRQVEPGFVFLENVPGLLVRGLGAVLRDLAEMGFHAEWGVLSACAIGAPHTRERVFVLAHSRRFSWKRGLVAGDCQDEVDDWNPEEWGEDREFTKVRPETVAGIRGAGWWWTEPSVGRMARRASSRMDRLRALGNAVVSQQACLALTVLMQRMRND